MEMLEGPGRLLLTVEQAAQVLSIGRTAIYALVKSGEIESVRIGRNRRVPYDALVVYVRKVREQQGITGWITDPGGGKAIE